jgi:mono/diheme cytochrome c family protein
MNISSYWLFALLFILILAIGVGAAVADRDGDWGERFFAKKYNMKVNNNQYSQLYLDECGSCHFPFQPGFLPAESWRKMMENLDDHFGENAELADEDRSKLLSYLTSNSADIIDAEIPKKVMWSLRYIPTPQRITETAFFRHEHDEIPPEIMQKGDEKLSFTNCDSCHTRAMQGSYNEHEIDIPGVGRWDD